jgi:hypothetical protein
VNLDDSEIIKFESFINGLPAIRDIQALNIHFNAKLISPSSLFYSQEKKNTSGH